MHLPRVSLKRSIRPQFIFRSGIARRTKTPQNNDPQRKYKCQNITAKNKITNLLTNLHMNHIM